MARFDSGFELPDNRYIAPQPVTAPQEQGAAPFFNLPQENQDLAYVEGITDQYYDTRGKIEAYASDMWKKYGIDVTQPDYSQPGTGGGVPFKTYQKLATQLLMTANDLKISREMEKQEAPYRMSGAIKDVGGFDSQAQPINRVAAEDRYFSTQLLPEVEAANKILEENVYTDADYKRFTDQVLTPTVANLRAQMLTPGISEGERQRLQFNIDALVQKPKTTPYASFQSRSTKKPTFEIDVLRKVKNDIQGRWSPGSFTPRTDENGDPVLFNPAWKGTRLGEAVIEVDGKERRVDKIIDGLLKKTDGVYFVFENADIPAVKVSSQKGDEIARVIMESNPKYGSADKMYEAMRELELTDDSGSLKPEALLAEGEGFDSGDPAAYGAGISAEKERIKTELKKTTEGGFQIARKTFSVVLPDGATVTFKPNRVGTGWYVSAGGESSDNLDEQDVINLLAEQKYFDQFLVTTPGATPQEEALGQLKEGSPLQREPGETQAAYDLRVIRHKRAQKQ